MQKTLSVIILLVSLLACNDSSSTWWIRDCSAPQDAPWLNETVTLKITFRFVGDPTVKCAQWGERVACSWSDGTIEIASQVDGFGKIVFPQAVLGHEVAHQLEYWFPDLFPDPDGF